MNILVLKTSTDVTIQKLFMEINEKENMVIDCLIQHNQVNKYKKEYPDINFIDICQERFESLPIEVVDVVSEKIYDQMYITLSGKNGYDFWNVISLASKIRFKNAFFYNCNGEKYKIPRENIIKDVLCRLYFKWINFIYK